MVIWTWIIFAALFFVLWKFAFGPIMQGLESREQTIRQSLDQAEQAREQLEQIEKTQEELIAKAQHDAKEIIEEARKAADEVSRSVKQKANEEAQVLIYNAEREIQEKQGIARLQLRQESADLAVAVAGKILSEKLDDEHTQKLTEKLINEI